MRALTSKDGGLLSHFDKIHESEAQIEKKTLKILLINNHDKAATKSKIRRLLPLEHIFGFCRTFKKVPELLGFPLTFKTELQDII